MSSLLFCLTEWSFFRMPPPMLLKNNQHNRINRSITESSAVTGVVIRREPVIRSREFCFASITIERGSPSNGLTTE